MSAGAPPSAIEALRMDKDVRNHSLALDLARAHNFDKVIVIDKSHWFEGLHSSINYAATRKNFEDYLYDPLMQIFGTYAKTCSHKDFEVAVIPQGCFELRADLSTRVFRKLSDVLFTIHSKSTGDPGDPQYGKSRLGGWVEGKPWVQSPKKPKKEEEANVDKKLDARSSNADGQDKKGKSKGIAEEVNVDERDIPQKEVDAEDDRRPDVEEVDAGEDPAVSVGSSSIADASALALERKEVIRRLVEDLHQLCQQAYFAFHHCVEDELYAFITYGMTISCFKFVRPANWDSIRGDNKGKVKAPIAILSNEFMVLGDTINPRLNGALRLLTASLDLSYQPSWFDPPDHDIGEPDLTIAQEALEKYKIKHHETDDSDGSPHGSPNTSTSSEESEQTPNWKPTAKEAAAPVGELRPKLRSGNGGSGMPQPDLEPAAENDGTETSDPAHEESTTFAPNLDPVAENEGIEMPEPALKQQDHADAASSDFNDSPLNQRLQPKLALSGRAQQAVDTPAISGIPGAAGPSTKDTHSLAGNTRAPAFKDLASGVNSKDKFITPKNRGKQIPKPRDKVRQRENTKSRTEATGPPLPALLSPPINDAATGDGLAGSGSHVLGHLPTSQEITGYDSRTGVRSRAKSHKRKGRPSSPLRADSRNSDSAEDSAPALAGPSKKRRLVPQADEQPVGDSTSGPSNVSRMEASMSALAARARDDAATERVFDPLTAPERARRRNTRVYQSHAAAERRARSKTKPAAGTAETATAVAEPAAPGPSGIRTRSTTGSSRPRVLNPPPPQRRDTSKNKSCRK
ncbi:hypothetical protein EWM64_g4554 [Hericium alpestre]|uniref:Uncharacterized protein n=1 Tax=Hericium alpestre TaxID=135208 RepID=A0A4Z0A154_9AGAM|nr:hypothetical protein EWM64_g4554 [Hericium alpestre]